MIKKWYSRKMVEGVIMRAKPLHIIDRFRLLFDGWNGFFNTVMTKPFKKGK